MKRLLFVAATLFAVRAQAQRTDTNTVLLPAVSVTATRTSVSTHAMPVTTTVFDRATFRDAGITQISDVLRLVPGATVLTNGSYGGQTSLFLRGGESDYVQVLVDGVPMNTPGGAFDFGQLTLDNIERVEVVRGPASVLYGSDAVSGVVQIFTRTGMRNGTHLSALAGGGSHGAQQFEGALTGKAAGLRWSLGGATHKTDGILPYNNEFRNNVGSAALRWTGQRVDVASSVRYTDYTFHYPTNSAGALSDTNAFATEKRLIASLDVGVKAMKRLELRARVAHNRAEPTVTDLPDKDSDHETFTSEGTITRELQELRAIATLGSAHVLTLAFENLRDQDDDSSLSVSDFGSFPGGLNEKRTNKGYSAQLLGNPGTRLTYTLGVRGDDNSKFGDFTTVRAAGAVRVTTSTSVRASYGTAFKAPTMFENFATGFTVGNPDLKPERSTAIEVGLQHATFGNRITMGVTAFSQRFRDLIQYNGAAAPGTPNYENLAEAQADGVELEGASRLGNRTLLHGSYTYLRTEVTDDGADDGPGALFVKSQRLVRRPTNSGTIGLRQTAWAGGSVDISATYTGEREDRNFAVFPAEPVVLKGFTRVDIGVVAPFGQIRGVERAAVVFRVENVFDTEYQQVFGFQSPKRLLFLGIRIGD